MSRMIEPPPRTVLPLGEDAVLIGASDASDAARIAGVLRASNLVLTEVVSGLASTMARSTEPLDAMVVAGALDHEPSMVGAHTPQRHTVDVVLDGADLAEVAERTALDRDGVARSLEESRLTVATIGFSPGFGYLQGLTGPLAALDRRPTPRDVVPAGSLAVAAGFCAIYPSSSPGGWWLLGRSDAVLFDQRAEAPGVLEVGDEVSLRVVSTVGAPPRAGFTTPQLPQGATPAIRLVEAPPGTVLVDEGRHGVAHLGVPTGGAMDPERAAAARWLAGRGLGALEVAGAGLIAKALAPVTVAGVDLGLLIDHRVVPDGVPVSLDAGHRLEVHRVGRGGRGYLGVSDGPLVEEVLGSMTTDALSGIGPGRISAGTVLGVAHVATSSAPVARRATVPADGSPARLRVLLGPHAGVLDDPGVLDGLLASLSASSNRVGYRLEPVHGPIRHEVTSVRSCPVIEGVIQLPPDGRPIVLGPDHATLGGYPVVAVVIAADRPVLGRVSPGELVELRVVARSDALGAREARRGLLASMRRSSGRAERPLD